MKTKIFYLLLLCLMVLGRGEVWADTTYEWSADGQKSTLSVTATNTANTGNDPSYYSNYSISYGGTVYTTAVKIDSKGQIVFTTSGVSNITIGVALKDDCDYSSKNANITLNNTKSATVSTGTGSSTQTGLELTYNNQPAGTYTITRGDNEVGIFYIKVVQTSKSTPTLGFQYGDNAAAVIPANESSTTVVNPLTTNPENAAVTWSITSAGTTGATVSNASGTEGQVTVSAAGTCVVRATTAETTNYAASYREYTLTVTKEFHREFYVSDLRYRPGTGGISASQMERTVGGYHLTFSGGNGIKCNSTNNFAFQHHSSGALGVMTIAMDDNNTEKSIRKIIFTAYQDPSLTVSSDDVTLSSGSLESTSTRVWTWTTGANSAVNTVTFTCNASSEKSFWVFKIDIYTSAEPTFTKITPTLTITPRTSDNFVVDDVVNVTDLDISTTPSFFLFDYSYDEGTTSLTHTPHTNNTTWPGTITGTASEGTATISASYDGSSNPFFNSVVSTTKYTLTVNSDSYSGPDTYIQTYPYKWDFTSTSSAWPTSQTQLRDTYDDWSQVGDNASYYTQTHNYGTYPIGYNIDIIKGLRFSQTWFGLDWTYGHIWFAGGSIVIPGLSAGQIVTFVMEGRDENENTTLTAANTTGDTYSITKADGSLAGSYRSYRYSVTAAGDVTFTFNHPVSIRSISVIDKLWNYTPDETTKVTGNTIVISGKAREFYTQGTVEFTGAGTLIAGTEITDMPGLTLTVGPANTENESHVGYAAKATEFIFTPTVNGYLSLNVYSSNSHTYLRKNNNTFDDLDATQTGNIWIGNYIATDDKPLIAGNTYKLHVKTDETHNPFYLHSFTFRPAFLNPSETGEQSKTDAFQATPALSSPADYPKMVHGNVGVSFSADDDKVLLANDGSLTLIGPGETWVKGKAISGSNELTAYYKLKSNVLSYDNITPSDGATITNLENNAVYVVFNEEITILDVNKVIVMQDGTTLTGITKEIAESTRNNYKKTLKIANFPSLSGGSTYTIRIQSECVKKTPVNGEYVTNPEKIFSFTVSSDEPPLTWLYPSTTTAVKIGSSIVLTTTQKIDETKPTTTVLGTLTYEGDNNSDDAFPMTIKAIKDDKNLVFKPTSPMLPNKLYTLTVEAKQVQWDNSDNTITVDKVYMFTTGTATGNAPILSSSFPADGSRIDLPASSTKVDLYFDQNVDLEPYSSVTIWPVNGGENLSTGNSDKLNSGILTAQNMTVDTENPKHVSFEIGSDIKYDLYYELKIPANTVTGPGGMPNNAKTVFFKINRNPNSHEVTASSFYPHTWDFNKFGNSATSTSSAYKIIDSATKQKADATKFNHLNTIFQSTSSDGYTTYTSKSSDNSNLFDQGNDVYIATSSATTETLREFEGIRLSLKKPNNGRFEIRNVTSKESTNKNADNTDKWQFRMNGNTHYMALSNVPVGKLYMKVGSNALIGINSPNAYFVEDDNFLATTHESNTKITNTNGTRKLVLNVTEAGDVTFCVSNFTCDKIAVSNYSKTFYSRFAINGRTYATDCIDDDIRPDLVNAFTNGNVKAYYVTSVSDGVATATEITSEQATASGEGTIVIYQSGVSTNTDVPFFVKDVNSTVADNSSNLLKGTINGLDNFSNPDRNKYFFTNIYKQLNEDKTDFSDTADWITDTNQMGFYRAMGNVVSAHKAWLEVPPSGGGARQFYAFSFPDENQNVTSVNKIERVILEDGEWYTLQGVRVAHPAKGNLYIHNGKKVFIK